MREPLRCTLLAAFGLAGLGCSTDTAGLARSAPEAQAAAAGEASASAGGGAGALSGSGGAAEQGAQGSPADPGTGSLDIVHGLVDGGVLLACSWDVETGEAIGEGTPAPSEGLGYGRSLRLPTDWDLGRALDVELFVAEAGAGWSCSGLRERAVDGAAAPRADAGIADAGGADAGAAALAPFPLAPRVPRRAGSVRLAPGVVRAGARYALVASGCTSPLGSPSDDICGPPDSLFESQQALVLAEIAPDAAAGAGFGLQFLNASRAVPRADLVLQADNQRESLRLTADVQFGAIRPRTAVAVREPVGVELHVGGAAQSSFTQAWAATLSASGVAALVPGENYLLVFVGPAPEASAAGVSPPQFVLVPGH